MNETVYNCRRCDTTGPAEQDRKGSLVCSECGSEDIQEVNNGQ